MAGKYTFAVERLDEARDEIKRKLPMPDEIATGLDGTEYMRLSSVVSDLTENDLESYAFSLKNSEVSIVLLALAYSCADAPESQKGICRPEIVSKLLFILRRRFHRGLFHLCWHLFQKNIKSVLLTECMDILAERLLQKYPDEYKTTLWRQLKGVGAGTGVDVGIGAGTGTGTGAGVGTVLGADVDVLTTENKSLDLKQHLDVISTIVSIIKHEKVNIRNFFSEYDIDESDELGFLVTQKYLSACDADMFLSNTEMLERHLIHCNRLLDYEMFCNVATNYLLKLNPLQQIDSVSSYIFFKMERLTLETKAVENLWCWNYLKLIEKHFDGNHRRIKPWKDAYNHINEVKKIGDTLFILFRSFVAVDIEGDDHTYIYMMEYFNNEYVDFMAKDESERIWRLIPEHVVDARDFIIEGIRGDIYKVGYDRVMLLYLKEMLGTSVKQA